MRRKHLFEFEDFRWFPDWLRNCMTNYILAMHKMLDSKKEMAALLDRALKHSSKKKILDLCSGAGGPLPGVYKELKEKYKHKDLFLELSDLYPNKKVANKINAKKDGISYRTDAVDATKIDGNEEGVRTMICSMHHMRPTVAKQIVGNAFKNRQPICVYEISDNSMPQWLFFITFPIAFLMVFFITPTVKPLSWQQLVFTYLIPIIPLFIAWDGLVSNIRTYTPADWEKLLKDFQSKDYTWEVKVIKNKVKKLYLLGLPV